MKLLANALSRFIMFILILMGILIVMRAMMYSMIIGISMSIMIIPFVISMWWNERKLKRELNKLKQTT